MPPIGFEPYDRAPHWRGHHEYFASRGVNAWRGGEIPSLSTNNYTFARQVAGLLLAHARSLPAGTPVRVLEVGAGLGTFATNLFRALDGGLGEAGRELRARLQYGFSDYALSTVGQAIAGPDLAPLVEAGRVRAFHYDVSRPATIRALDGKPVEPFHAVIANYLCCVLPTKHLQKNGDVWSELCVRTAQVEPESGAPKIEDAGPALLWSPVPLGSLFADAGDARVVEALLGDAPAATVSVPYGFFDFLRGVGPLLAEDALTIVADYGTVGRDVLLALRDLQPTLYGKSVNQEVCFALFDGFAQEAGFACLRTLDPVRAVHTALLARQPLAAPVVQAFDDLFVQRHAGQEFLDVVAAARMFLEKNDHQRAMRLFRRAIEQDPHNAELHLRLGIAAVAGGYEEIAVEALLRGRELDTWRQHDFDFELGRAYTGLGDAQGAIACYQTSLAREQHPVTYSNLGALYHDLGDPASAYRMLRRAQQLDPENVRVREQLEWLKDSWWNATVRDLEPTPKGK